LDAKAAPQGVIIASDFAWRISSASVGRAFDGVFRTPSIAVLRPCSPNHGDLAAAREGCSPVLGDRRPASTLIVGGLANPAWKIEVEGIAVA
jgi:2-iminobutanoate/2-iminopropanoate deaminase